MKAKEIDESLLIKLYKEDLLSIVKCAEILKVSESCIRRILKKLKIIIRSPGEQLTHRDITKEQVVDLYSGQGLSISQCAEKLNKSETFIKNRLKTSGIKTRSVIEGLRKFHNTDHITDKEIIDLYENKKMSTYEISAHFNKSPYFARQRLWAIDYPMRNNAGENNGSWKGDLQDENVDLFEKIKFEYENGQSLNVIREKYKMSFYRLKRSFENGDIIIRNKQEAIRLFHEKIPVDKHTEICNRYNNNKTESCGDIAKDYNVTPETIGNILRYNGVKPENFGQRLKCYKGGVTSLHDMIRSGSKYISWRTDIFKRNLYKSNVSEENGTLNCHHIIPFSILLQTVIKRNMILLNNPQLYRYTICNDERFYDPENGLSLLETEHRIIEKFDLNGHPWWRIWKAFPSYGLINSGLTENDMLSFDSNGKIDASKSILLRGTKDEIKNIIKHEHYLGTIPNASTILISKIGNVITGIATFGRGANKNLGDDTIELTRLCIPYYVIKPYGSTFLMMCNNYIREHFPEIKKLISYADPSVGHNGGIYRMAGWEKAGQTSSNYCYFDPFVYKLKHKSCCRRIKNVDKSEKQLAEENGLIKIPLPPKYRYIYNLY